MATTPNRNYPRPVLGEAADIDVVGQAIDAIDADMATVVAGGGGRLLVVQGTVVVPGVDVGNSAIAAAVQFDVTFPEVLPSVPFVALDVSDSRAVANVRVGGGYPTTAGFSGFVRPLSFVSSTATIDVTVAWAAFYIGGA